MIRISPAIRISLGLVFISLSVLLLGNFIGLIQDQSTAAMEARKSAAELLAMQCTLAAQFNNVDAIRKTMDVMVELRPDVLSLGMRNADNRYIAQTQIHQIQWEPPPGEGSTSLYWQVPIHKGTKRWGTLEISFAPQDSLVVLGYRVRPFTLMLAVFSAVSFLAFVIFMRRSLQHLDPTTVMPSRVKYALDTLTEGVILMDNRERIILANSAFAKKLGSTVESLMGLKASKLGWLDPGTDKPPETLLWTEAMYRRETKSGIPLNLDTKVNGIRNFMANVAPILDDKGKSRGALATFDDITELEESHRKMEIQNQKLEILATQDSLTGCLNRRAFYERAEEHLATTIAGGSNLSCIMADIDLFKSVNDRYGHAVGDQVIQFVAATLKSALREDDLVCRYGGEEFCLILSNCNIENAVAIIDRVRRKIVTQSGRAIPDKPGIHVSASFGISDLSLGAEHIEELISQADNALYKAKADGRNRVVSWDSSITMK